VDHEQRGTAPGMEIAPVDVIDDARALLYAVNRGYLGDLWGNFGLHWRVHFFLTKSILRFFANGVEATEIHENES
jgi:hypothetical protein